MANDDAPTTRARAGAKAKGKAVATTSTAKSKPASKAPTSKASKEALAKAKTKARGKKAVEEEIPPPSEDEYDSSDEVVASKPTYNDFLTKYHGMKFEQGQFVDTAVLEKMGIYEDVMLLFENMGLGKFMMMKEEAFKAQSCVFLASLRVAFYEEGDERAETAGFGIIKFRINGVTYRVTFREICEIFGFKEEGTYGGPFFDYPRGELQRLWSTIASGNFEPGGSKNASIRHPALRYVHKALVHMFYAKVEIDSVTSEEMELMGVGLKPLLPTLRNGEAFEGNERTPCLATLLVRQLLAYKEWAWKTKAKKAAICIGWVITPILMKTGVKLSLSSHKWKLLDEGYLTRTRFAKGVQDSKIAYNLQLNETFRAQVLLPNPSLTTIREPRNVIFYPTSEHLYNRNLDQPIDVFRARTAKRKGKSIAQDAPEASHASDDEAQEEPSPDPTYGSERYHFDPYDGAMPNIATRHAHHQSRLLQRWCKWQDTNMRKMVKTITSLKKKVKSMGKVIKELRGDGGEGTSRGRDHEARGEMVTHEEASRATAREEKAAKRRAMRSPSPISSNPSYSMGSSSPSQSF